MSLKIYISWQKLELSYPPDMHSVLSMKISYHNLWCCLDLTSLHLSRKKYVLCRVSTGTFLEQVSRAVLTVTGLKAIWIFALKSLKRVWKVEYWIEKLVSSRQVKYMHSSNLLSWQIRLQLGNTFAVLLHPDVTELNSISVGDFSAPTRQALAT